LRRPWGRDKAAGQRDVGDASVPSPHNPSPAPTATKRLPRRHWPHQGDHKGSPLPWTNAPGRLLSIVGAIPCGRPLKAARLMSTRTVIRQQSSESPTPAHTESQADVLGAIHCAPTSTRFLHTFHLIAAIDRAPRVALAPKLYWRGVSACHQATSAAHLGYHSNCQAA
jgi:hypothetical protein